MRNQHDSKHQPSTSYSFSSCDLTDCNNFSTFVRRENVEKMVGEVKMQIEEENEEKPLEDKVEEERGNVVWVGGTMF